MLYPSFFGENLFDDLFRFPDFNRDVEKKLYGKHAAQIMKTDVHEHDDHYEIVIDLPGFKKDQINLELQNGQADPSGALRRRNAEELLYRRYCYRSRCEGEV